jgi:multidrug resistance efflux pump
MATARLLETLRGIRGLLARTLARSRGRLAELSPRQRAVLLSAAAGAVLVLAAAWLWLSAGDAALTARVRRGDLVVQLTEGGLLKPEEALTYRSPLGGREAEIVFLVAEGTRVGEGDLLVRLDTTELKRELERGVQEFRQAQVDVQVADAERQEGAAAVDAVRQGEGALGVDEARSHLKLAEKKALRLREEYEKLKPLMDRGFITREELERSSFELEQAEADLGLARRKAEVYIQQTHPRGEQRARLQLAQKEAQVGNVRARVAELAARVRALGELIENCSIYARRPGLVVHEENLAANPRRKVRVGDRVTGSQGVLTIPEVSRMLVEASVAEADVHRVRPGQAAAVRLDAFPDLRLSGKVVRVGTMARSSAERPFEDKRFDLIVALDPAEVDLKPEMTARVDILVEEMRNVLLVPVNAVFERQGTTVCQVLRTLGVVTRPVVLGSSDQVSVEVRSGLREGERLSLVDRGGAALPAAGGAPAAGAPSAAERNQMVPGKTGGGSAWPPLGPR